jgi:hypothetical protein
MRPLADRDSPTRLDRSIKYLNRLIFKHKSKNLTGQCTAFVLVDQAIAQYGPQEVPPMHALIRHPG